MNTKTKVSADKPNNFLVVKLAYDLSIVLPYEAGMQLLNSLQHAEALTERYSEDPRIDPLDTKDISFGLLSEHKYKDIKTAMLLTGNKDA